MRRSRRHVRTRLALIAATIAAGVALGMGSNMASGAEVHVTATVARRCSVSIEAQTAIVRSNIPWTLLIATPDGRTETIQGGPTNATRVPLDPGARVEMTTR